MIQSDNMIGSDSQIFHSKNNIHFKNFKNYVNYTKIRKHYNYMQVRKLIQLPTQEQFQFTKPLVTHSTIQSMEQTFLV